MTMKNLIHSRVGRIFIFGLAALIALWLLARIEQYATPQVPLKSTNPPFEVMKHDASNIETYAILIPSGGNGKAVAEKVEEICKWSCSVDIFDNRRAFSLHERYKTMGPWADDDYLFVAEHYVGRIYFESGTYVKYPFKDEEEYKNIIEHTQQR